MATTTISTIIATRIRTSSTARNRHTLAARMAPEILDNYCNFRVAIIRLISNPNLMMKLRLLLGWDQPQPHKHVGPSLEFLRYPRYPRYPGYPGYLGYPGYPILGPPLSALGPWAPGPLHGGAWAFYMRVFWPAPQVSMSILPTLTCKAAQF